MADGTPGCARLPSLLDVAIVLPQPVRTSWLMCRCVIPDQQHRSEPLRCHALTAPGQKRRCLRADRATLHKAQQHLFGLLGDVAHQEAIVGQCFRIEIGFGPRLSTKRKACPSGAQVCSAGCASRLHQTSSPKPSPVGWVAARAISRSRRFCSNVCRIGTGDPVFGPLPAYAKACQGAANAFATDGAGACGSA